MIIYHNTAVLQFADDTTGNAAVAAPVTVRDNETQALSIIHDIAGNQIANPLSTDTKGNYVFAVNSGSYDVIIKEGTVDEVKLEKALDDTAESTNVFTPYSVDNIQAGDSVINVDITFNSALLIIDGNVQKQSGLTPDYVFDGNARTITMLNGFTFTGNEEVELLLNNIPIAPTPVTGVGKISNYLNMAQDNTGAAYTLCCVENDIVDLEGLPLSTEDIVTIPANAKVKKVLHNGSVFTILSSSLRYLCKAPEHVGPGSLKGGAALKQIAVTTGINTNKIILKNVTGLKVGDIINSSLDVFYLPNSTARAGYQDEGDFNRITAINTVTNEITLSYNFLRPAYTVSSGLIAESWVGVNTSFDSAGIQFLHPDHQDILFTDVTISNWAGYIMTRADIEADINEVGSSYTFTRCTIKEQFLDVISFRGKDMNMYHNTVSRIYDFAKQFVVYNQPLTAVNTITGNDIAHQNGDNCFYNRILLNDTITSFGTFMFSGNRFNGTKPADLPESDFSGNPGAQLYFGINVPIHDCYHFCAPGGGGTVVGKGFHSNGDSWVGFARGIFGTTFNPQPAFSYDSCTFTGSSTSCEPVYVNVAGKGSDQLLQDYKATLNGGDYNSRSSGFCRGVMVSAYNINITLSEVARTSPQVNGFTLLNNVHMTDGTINGRYKIDSNYSTFRDVHLAYQGTSNLNSVVLFGVNTLDDSSNFILDVPENFEGTGLTIDDWAGDLPISAWFGSSASGVAPTPGVKFRLAGRTNQYTYGNNSTKNYLQEIVAPKVTAAPSPTKGLFSAKLEIGDSIVGTADNTIQVVNQSSQSTVTTNAAATGATSTITVSATPLFTPTHVAVYSNNPDPSKKLRTWFYYLVDSVSGSVITPVGNITREFFVGDAVYLISAAEVSSAGGSELLSVKVRRDTDITIPNGVETHVSFETEDHNEIPGVFNLSSPTRLTVPAGISRVDLSATVRYLALQSGAQVWHRIIHYNSDNTVKDFVAVQQANVGYQQHVTSTAAQDVDVVAGDYFTMSVLHNDSVTTTPKLNRATFSLRKVK